MPGQPCVDRVFLFGRQQILCSSFATYIALDVFNQPKHLMKLDDIIYFRLRYIYINNRQ